MANFGYPDQWIAWQTAGKNLAWHFFHDLGIPDGVNAKILDIHPEYFILKETTGGLRVLCIPRAEVKSITE